MKLIKLKKKNKHKMQHHMQRKLLCILLFLDGSRNRSGFEPIKINNKLLKQWKTIQDMITNDEGKKLEEALKS